MKFYNVAAVIAIVLIGASCTWTGSTDEGENAIDTLVTVKDSTVWGVLGEGTGMSVFEFITDDGDTLYVRRTSEYTYDEAEVYGEVRNYTDKWAFILSDNNETLKHGVNYTMVQEKLSQEDGPKATNMWNGLLIIENKYTSENGATQVLDDTVSIQWLDKDSLVYIDHNRLKQTIQ